MHRRKDDVDKKFRRGPTHPRVAHSCLSTLGKTCQGDHSDKATTCPRGPLQLGPRARGVLVVSSHMTLDKETTCTRGLHSEGPLSGRLRPVSLYRINVAHTVTHCYTLLQWTAGEVHMYYVSAYSLPSFGGEVG